MLPSSPSPCTWLSHAPSTTLDTTPHRLVASFPFHSTPSPTCAAFRLCRLGSGINPFPGFPLRVSIPLYLTTAFPQPGAYGASQVLQRISSCMPQPEDSGGHPHPHPDGCFMLASVNVKTLAVRNTHFEAVPAFRARGCPYGLQDSLCTLHLPCSPA